jgi:hypothetical protein
MMADITIYGKGFYQIQGETKRGLQFMRRVQGTQDGITYCDDSRLTQDIANGAVKRGLRVEVNGVHYRGE